MENSNTVLVFSGLQTDTNTINNAPPKRRKNILSLAATTAVVIGFVNPQLDTNKIFIPSTFSVSPWNSVKSDEDIFLEETHIVRNTLSRIYSTICEVFGKIPVATSVYRDTEEDWQNLLITINSGMSDFIEMRTAKKKLFSSFALQGIDASILKHITFSIE